jgi:hypothetical protein
MTVTLKTAYLGYRRGSLTGNKDGYRNEIELASGLLIYLYEDEYEVD